MHMMSAHVDPFVDLEVGSETAELEGIIKGIRSASVEEFTTADDDVYIGYDGVHIAVGNNDSHPCHTPVFTHH